MIDAIVWVSLTIFSSILLLWILDPRLRQHAEKPKQDVQERIGRFEVDYPGRDL
jgi:hypothetical protein